MMTKSMRGREVEDYINDQGRPVAVHDTGLDETLLGLVSPDGDVYLGRIPDEDEYDANGNRSPVWEQVRDDRVYLVWMHDPR